MARSLVFALPLSFMVTVARADSSMPSEAWEVNANKMKCAAGERSWWSRDEQSERVKRWKSELLPLTFVQAGAHALLFSTWQRGKPRHSVVIDAASGRRLLDAQDEPGAIVERADGRFEGFLVVDSPRHELRLLDGPKGRIRWRSPVETLVWDNAASVVIAGDRLIAGIFNHGATRSSLIAFDLASGHRLWAADVEQLIVAHSKYWNDVQLELHGGLVHMLGHESAGCYLQIFDVVTGRRVYEQRKMR
jgi:hypothetical protein